MKLSVPFAFIIIAATAVAQDLPEKTTDSLTRNDLILGLFTSVKPHTLSDLRQRPDAYRGTPVEMEVQFHESRKGGNPFFTRFTDDLYMCFSAWGTEQSLWKKDDYQKDFSFLFVDRKTPDMRVVLDSKLYNRIKFTATVRDVFRGIPYVEVTKVQILDDSVSEAAIVHGAKAAKLSQAGDTAGALAEYERAMRGDMPALSKAQMHIDMASVYLQRAERDNAIVQLERAKKLQPNDAAIVKAVEKIKALPATMLNVDGLKELPEELRNPKSAGTASRPAKEKKAAETSESPAPADAKPAAGK